MARKYFPHNSVIFCTSRIEQGLPLVCTHNLNFIINGILAKATSIYNVEVNHHIFMSNHFHIILRVINPEDVQAFFRYIKTEIAHAVNRLLGRRKRTVWVDRYDSPIVLDAEKLLHLVTYLYLNPVKANLVESIDHYPGVSSWKMFKDDVLKSSLVTVFKKRFLKSSLVTVLITKQLSLNATLFALLALWFKIKQYYLCLSPPMF